MVCYPVLSFCRANFCLQNAVEVILDAATPKFGGVADFEIPEIECLDAERFCKILGFFFQCKVADQKHIFWKLEMVLYEKFENLEKLTGNLLWEIKTSLLKRWLQALTKFDKFKRKQYFLMSFLKTWRFWKCLFWEKIVKIVGLQVVNCSEILKVWSIWWR